MGNLVGGCGCLTLAGALFAVLTCSGVNAHERRERAAAAMTPAERAADQALRDSVHEGMKRIKAYENSPQRLKDKEWLRQDSIATVRAAEYTTKMQEQFDKENK